MASNGPSCIQDNEQVLLFACVYGYSAIVERYLKDPHRISPKTREYAALVFASDHGHLDIVEQLLPLEFVEPTVDPTVPSINISYAIMYASRSGHLAVVERLLKDPRIDPSYKYNSAVILADNYGHSDIVNRLLKDPRVDRRRLEQVRRMGDRL